MSFIVCNHTKAPIHGEGTKGSNSSKGSDKTENKDLKIYQCGYALTLWTLFKFIGLISPPSYIVFNSLKRILSFSKHSPRATGYLQNFLWNLQSVSVTNTWSQHPACKLTIDKFCGVSQQPTGLSCVPGEHHWCRLCPAALYSTGDATGENTPPGRCCKVAGAL